MDPKQQNALALALIGTLAVVSAWLLWPLSTSIDKGLDIQGGLSVILTAKPIPGQTLTAEQMDRAETIITNRVNGLGVSEASVQRQGTDSLLVQLPGIKDAEGALKALGSTGRLEFVDWASVPASEKADWDAYLTAANQGKATDRPKPLVEGTYESFLGGETVKNAVVSTREGGQIVVNVEMDSAGAKIWGDYTTRSVGKQVAIVLDGVVQSAPTVNEPILDGSTQISGSFTAEEAKQLAAVLESGALPVTLEASESRVVGPTLGAQSLQQGLIAGLVGLGVVCAFMALFYRGFGVLSWVSLAVFSVLELGILALLSRFNMFALSLPGVAGIVLSIGIAADSSILMFERFKEEVRMGKTARSASRSSTRHALGTSITADLVTFISALVIWSVAIGPVKGFAFTLMLGIVCDLTVAILFTRTIIIMLAESVVSKMPGIFGLRAGDAS